MSPFPQSVADSSAFPAITNILSSSVSIINTELIPTYESKLITEKIMLDNKYINTGI